MGFDEETAFSAASSTTDSEHDNSLGIAPIKSAPQSRNRSRSQDQSRSRSRNRSTSHLSIRSRASAAEQQRLDDQDLFEDLQRAHSVAVETEAERAAREPITYTRSGASVGSTASRPPDFEVVFDENDREDPRNWPLLYRCWTIFVVSFSTWVVVLYSTSYTASAPGLSEEFNASSTVTTLGVTTYLLGLASGCLVVAPMSELYGRNVVYLVCYVVWALLIIPCALAHSLTSIIIVRYFGACFGAVMISNGPGTVVDVSNPDYLAVGMSLFSVAPLNGPVTGPVIGGFVFQHLGWRWTNWIVLIMAGLAIGLLLTLRETYAPIILKRKAARLRKETDDPRWWCQYDQKLSSLGLIKLNLSRPFILFWTEPILWFMNIWISVVYAILYLCFVAYPIVFSQHRGWSPQISGLAFLGIGVGVLCSLAAEPLLRRLINSQPRDPQTGKVEPEATALVMAIGGVLTPIGQLSFSWTCLPTSIHWAAPIVCGIPFGAGNTLIFIYGSNYIAGAYGIYAASAMAGNAVIRSIAGGTLPLAGSSMYAALTPQWAGTLLGLLEVVLIPIPFIFWRYGDRIRAKSKVIRQLREEQDRLNAKRTKHQAKLANKVAIQRQMEEEGILATDGNVEKNVNSQAVVDVEKSER